MPEPLSTPELLLELYAYRVIADWPSVDREVTACVKHRGVEVAITLRPVGIPVVGTLPALTPCQRDVLEVIANSERRLTRPEIQDTLDKSDRIHGESTVRTALAELVRLGFIESPGAGRNAGYGLLNR